MENVTVMTTHKSSWLIPLSVIKPGNSAILNDNYFAFYWIHVTGMILTFTSFTCCIVVVKDILTSFLEKRGNVKLWDFSDRFPLYIAIADALWGITNIFGNHAVLLYGQVLPSKGVAEKIAAVVAFFYGYQQLMTAGLSLYTYLKIVRRRSGVSLGRLEWKLHLACVLFLTLNVVECLYYGAYGNSGYWFMPDWSTLAGRVLSCYIVVTSTITALLTTLCYRSIQRVILNQKRRTMVLDLGTNPASSSSYHVSAIKCLTTYVAISLFLYWPFAILGWIFLVQHFCGFQEPTTIWLVALTANCGGWVNSWGYFHNKRIKNGMKHSSNPAGVDMNLSSPTGSSTTASFVVEANVPRYETLLR